MAKNEHDIQSTEKLLKLIRDPQHDDSSANTDNNLSDTGQTAAAPRADVVSFKRKPTVGIDIGHNHIRLAKIATVDRQDTLIDYLDVPISKSISLEDETFLKTLKTTLDRFCKNRTACSLWGAIHSANVEIRSIQIPKLPRKQVANAIFWTFSKKVAFDPQHELLDYDILGDVTVGGLKKTEAVAYKAPKADVALYRSAFQKIGYPLTGISIVPFAIQNLFKQGILPHADKDACCLFVGRDWSRIAIYNKGNLVLSRGIKAGMRSMIEAIHVALARTDEWQAEPSDQDTKNIDRPYSAATMNPKAQQIFFDFIGHNGSRDHNPLDQYGLDTATVFQMILPAIERLVRQIERTFEHYAINYNREGVRRVFISGQVIASAAIIDYASSQLDLPVIPMNPFPANAPFVREINVPAHPSQREGYVPAIGLGLSSNTRTPNFLYTHKDKDITESVRRTNMRILTSCMIILMVMIGIFSWQQKQLDAKRNTIAKLEQRLVAFSPPAEKDVMLALFAKTKNQRQSIANIVQRYTPLAIVTELSSITPPTIRLLDISANLRPPAAAGPNQPARQIMIEGIIFGDPSFFETSLTSYMLSLRRSLMFSKPNIQRKRIEYYDAQEVLRFAASLEIE